MIYFQVQVLVPRLELVSLIGSFDFHLCSGREVPVCNFATRANICISQSICKAFAAAADSRRWNSVSVVQQLQRLLALRPCPPLLIPSTAATSHATVVSISIICFFVNINSGGMVSHFIKRDIKKNLNFAVFLAHSGGCTCIKLVLCNDRNIRGTRQERQCTVG